MKVWMLMGWMLMSQLVMAQITVKGIITDAGGEALIGVNIIEKGTTNGTVTDLDGRYEFTVDTAATLVISYVGFETLERLVDAGEINIELFDSITLNECLVVGQRFTKHQYSVVQSCTQSISGVAMSIRRSGVSTSRRNKDKQVIQPVLPHHGDYASFKDNDFFNTSKSPVSTFSADVDRASYSNMRSYLERGYLPPADAVRIEEMINYFPYDYPVPETEVPLRIITETTNCEWNNKHKLLLVAMQGKQIDEEILPPSNLVFLIDVSGSMQSEEKLPLLKQSFRFLIEKLRPQDHVSIVVYAGSSGLVLRSTSGDEKMAIQKAINRLNAGGSTAGAEGIELAYRIAEKNFIKGGNNRVILATDGDFNVGISNNEELEKLIAKKRETGVFLSVLGFGYNIGNYQENKMQTLAQAGNGNHSYIDNILEAEKVFSKEFASTNFTIAKDVKIQIEFNPAAVAAYRLIGYVNRLLEEEDFEDDQKDAGEIGVGHTVTALYEIIPAGVQSSFLPKEVRRKYTETSVTINEDVQNELATVKLRYKLPDGDVSTELEHIVLHEYADEKSETLKWAELVAMFGMKLRASEYLYSSISYYDIYKNAKVIFNSLEDPVDEQSEFLSLVKQASRISETALK